MNGTEAADQACRGSARGVCVGASPGWRSVPAMNSGSRLRRKLRAVSSVAAVTRSAAASFP